MCIHSCRVYTLITEAQSAWSLSHLRVFVQMEAQRQQLFAQWEAKLSQAQEATEAANAAHTADKEAVESAASQALAAAAGETAIHTCHKLCIAVL